MSEDGSWEQGANTWGQTQNSNVQQNKSYNSDRGDFKGGRGRGRDFGRGRGRFQGRGRNNFGDNSRFDQNKYDDNNRFQQDDGYKNNRSQQEWNGGNYSNRNYSDDNKGYKQNGGFNGNSDNGYNQKWNNSEQSENWRENKLSKQRNCGDNQERNSRDNNNFKQYDKYSGNQGNYDKINKYAGSFGEDSLGQDKSYNNSKGSWGNKEQWGDKGGSDNGFQNRGGGRGRGRSFNRDRPPPVYTFEDPWLLEKLQDAKDDPWAKQNQLEAKIKKIYQVENEDSADTFQMKGANYEAYEGNSQKVNVLRYKGNYKPLVTFQDDRIPQQMQQNLQVCKYFKSTPIQANAIPICLEGKDIIACAQTGSGKTAAYFLPILIQMHNNKVEPNPPMTDFWGDTYVKTLVICPTRELCAQIHDEVRKYGHMLGYKPVVSYGGLPLKFMRQMIQVGCDFLIATPGRLKHILTEKMFRLDQMQNLVLDEADRMFDEGFRDEIGQIIKEFNMPGPEVRQTFMFSATFRDDVRETAEQYLKKDYVFISIGEQGSTSDLIRQEFHYMSLGDDVTIEEVLETKTETLISLLQEDYAKKKVLVFAQSKTVVEDLAATLMQDGVSNVTSISGQRKQNERELALDSFKQGRCPVLVATDVAARGLDIPQVELVYNYDMPRDIHDYIHRIGRTGRVGNKGMSMSILTQRDYKIAPGLITLLQKSNQVVPDFLHGLAKLAEVEGGGGRRGGARGGAGGGGGSYINRGRNQPQQQEATEWDNQEGGEEEPQQQKPSLSNQNSNTAINTTKTFNSQPVKQNSGYDVAKPQQSSSFNGSTAQHYPSQQPKPSAQNSGTWKNGGPQGNDGGGAASWGQQEPSGWGAGNSQEKLWESTEEQGWGTGDDQMGTWGVPEDVSPGMQNMNINNAEQNENPWGSTDISLNN